MERALIVFAKPIVPGTVKTRLTSMLSDREAAALYGAFLRDTLEQYTALNIAIRLYWAGKKRSLPEWLDRKNISVHPQTGEHLGSRMCAACVESFEKGYQKLILVGTDSPTLPVEYVHYAFLALEQPNSIVIGPSEDGGFYLLGMSQLYKRLFKNMLYSHPHVFRETIKRAETLEAAITVLSRWYDVDTTETLKKLLVDVTNKPHKTPHTAIIMQELVTQYPAFFR